MVPKDGREYRQSPADRNKLDGLYECNAYYVLAAPLHATHIGGTLKSSLVLLPCFMLIDGFATGNILILDY